MNVISHFLFVLITSAVCCADGPDLKQHVWLSNGMVFASADIPACHYARWERKVLPSTNWFAADSADYSFTTRRVVFSEAITAWVPFYRVHVIYVPWCASLTLSP